jgi:hypothetical protein
MSYDEYVSLQPQRAKRNSTMIDGFDSIRTTRVLISWKFSF